MENIKKELENKLSFLKYLEKFNLSKEERCEIDNKMACDAYEIAHDIIVSDLRESFIEGYINGYNQAIEDGRKNIEKSDSIIISYGSHKFEELKEIWEKE